MHYFSKQIVIKSKLSADHLYDKLSDYPKTDQWLRVVGLSKDTVKVSFVLVLYIPVSSIAPDKDWRLLGIYPPLFGLIGYFNF